MSEKFLNYSLVLLHSLQLSVQVPGEMRMNQSCVSHLSKEPQGDHELCCLGCYLERKRPQESFAVGTHNKPRKKEKNPSPEGAALSDTHYFFSRKGNIAN